VGDSSNQRGVKKGEKKKKRKSRATKTKYKRRKKRCEEAAGQTSLPLYRGGTKVSKVKGEKKGNTREEGGNQRKLSKARGKSISTKRLHKVGNKSIVGGGKKSQEKAYSNLLGPAPPRGLSKGGKVLTEESVREKKK